VYSTRALTLSGPGGIGKTRLALRLLTAMAAEFPDRVWFVELADLRQPDLVISRVAAVLGVSEEPGRPLLETMADVLRRRRLLLALDNCEHLIDACADITRQLLASSPGLRLVITSREPLRVAGEAVRRVPPLSAMSVTTSGGAKTGSQDEAVRLFAARAAAAWWNEGYALGTRAAIAARAGKLREAEQLASASVIIMRRIDQRWGVARVLLGLADLARLRGQPGEAHDHYVEALPVLEEIGARPEIARCLAGLGRVALDLGAVEQARRHLTRSLKLSQATGTRIGVARGIEALATLAVREKQPERAVQLAAAAAALRESAGVPPLPPARIETYLASARHLGEPAVARIWAQGLTLSSEAAVALAVDARPSKTADGDARALTIVEDAE